VKNVDDSTLGSSSGDKSLCDLNCLVKGIEDRTGVKYLEKELFLDTVKLSGIQAGGRQHGQPVVFGYSDEYVAVVQVVKVVSESAERVQDGLGVPSLLKLYPLGLDGARMQDVFNVDGKSHKINLRPMLA
jgi:hypothetical protein